MRIKKQEKTAKTTVSDEHRAVTTDQIYHSDPFRTSYEGVKKLFQFNLHSLLSKTLLNIFLACIAALTLLGILSGVFSLLPQSFTALVFGPEIAQMHNLVGRSMAVLWIVCGVIILLLLSTIILSMEIKLASMSSQGKHIGFINLLNRSLSRVWSLFSLKIVAIGTALITYLMCLLCIESFGYFGVLPSIVIIGIMLYLSMRLLFAPFALVVEKLGPVESLRRSWNITELRTAEVLGVIFASAVFTLFPLGLLSVLVANMSGPVFVVLSVFYILALLIAGSIFTAGLGERYEQFRMTDKTSILNGKKHIGNFFSPLIFILCAILISGVTPLSSYAPKEKAPTPLKDALFETNSEKEAKEIINKLEEKEKEIDEKLDELDDKIKKQDKKLDAKGL